MQSLREPAAPVSRVESDTSDHRPRRGGGTVRHQSRALEPSAFRERLLAIMDRKNHWAWPYFSGPDVTRAQLRIHFQQEYATYVRDFPVLLARVHGRNPPTEVRRMLAENIYEEDTGGLSFGTSHPELFLRMMSGLGLPGADFEQIALLPAARAYRTWLDRVTGERDWVRAAAVMAIFVEGSIKDRDEILAPSRRKTEREIETVVRNHPLVRHHGVSPDCMDLTRAHQLVESGHRHDAYGMVIAGVKSARRQQAVISAVEKTLSLWMCYRDGVAHACGLTQPRVAATTRGS